MKISFKYIIAILCIITLYSCKKDNYDAPSSMLSGRLVYQGAPIQVEYDRVSFQLFQFGFGKVGALGGTFDQDGKYSMLLFDGEYKFTIPNGQGPFLWKKTPSGTPDSLTIDLRGAQTVDIEVTPYYMVRNPQLSASGQTVSGSFGLDKIIDGVEGKDVERVNLYVNKTLFVSGANNIATSSLDGSEITDLNNINLQVTVPAMTPSQNYVFARIGVKIAGVEDMIFSQIEKINL